MAFSVVVNSSLKQRTRSEIGGFNFRKDLGLLLVTGKKRPISDQRVPSNSVRDFKIQQRDRNENVKEKNRFNKQNNNFALASLFFFTFLLPFLHDYDVKMRNFVFYGEPKQATAKFYFSLWTWIWSLGIQLHPRGSAYILQSERVGIIVIKTERTQIYFLRDLKDPRNNSRKHICSSFLLVSKGLFSWRWGTSGSWGSQLWCGNRPVHIISYMVIPPIL